MPITQSAKKALRGSLRKRERNVARKERYKKAIKEYRKLVANKQWEEAKKFLPSVQKTLDKIAKSGLIKKNKASRLKSRLTKKLAAANE